MQLALTDDEAKFRDELREFYTSEIPAEIREHVREGREIVRDDIATSHRILNAHGLAVPGWPVEWGGKNWTPTQRRLRHRDALMTQLSEQVVAFLSEGTRTGKLGYVASDGRALVGVVLRRQRRTRLQYRP